MTPCIQLAVVAAGLGIVLLAWMRRQHQPRAPLSSAPRIAAIALVTEAVAVLGADRAADTGAMTLAILVAIAVLEVAVLASLSVTALRAGPAWVLTGVLLWLVGWAARTTDVCSAIAIVIAWLRDAPMPAGIDSVDSAMFRLAGLGGGLVIGGALVRTVEDRRIRRAMVALLVCNAAFGGPLVDADYWTRDPTGLRLARNVLDGIAAVSLAGAVWLYWRQVTRSPLPRAVGRPRS